MKYRVEPFDCDTWNVVDPNGNVCCQRDDEEDAKTEAFVLNRAYELGEAAALARVRVLEEKLKACEVDATNALRPVRFDGQTVWGDYYEVPGGER